MSRLISTLGIVVSMILLGDGLRLGSSETQACSANVQSMSKRQAQFDGVTFAGLLAVYADFRKNPDLTPKQRNIGCYDINILVGDKYHTITLIPKQPKQEDVFIIGGRAPWGRGVIYKVDTATDKIIERYDML